MLKLSFKYTKLKAKKWFSILLFITIFQSAIIQAVNKLLLVSVGENVNIIVSYLLFAVITSPLQLGLIKILKTLHEEHRFRPNQLFYFYSYPVVLKALGLGLLNSGFQTLFNVLSDGTQLQATTDISSTFSQTTMLTAMFSSALTIFLFCANYSFVNDPSLSVIKCWADSFKQGMQNIVSIAVAVFGGYLISNTLSQIITFGLSRLLTYLSLPQDVFSIVVVILGILIQGIFTVLVCIFQYGLARQIILNEYESELLQNNTTTSTTDNE